MCIQIPDGVVIGRPPGVGSGSDIDLSDIDLTAPELDSRIRYQCASHHAYIAADSTIQFADPDVWPLEYANGVAIGRHEPEPQATNRATLNVLSGMWNQGTPSISVSDAGAGIISGFPARTYTTQGDWSRPVSNSGVSQTDEVTVTVYVKREPTVAPTFVFYDGGTTNYRNQIDVNTLEFTKNSELVTTRAVSLGGWAIARGSLSTARGLNSYLYPFFNGDKGRFATFNGWQVESGLLSTSPVNSPSPGGTRDATGISVRAYSGVKNLGIQIIYTDGTTDTVSFNGIVGGWYQLPFAKHDWGTRYIQRIKYLIR